MIRWPPLPMIEPASCQWSSKKGRRKVGRKGKKKKKPSIQRSILVTVCVELTKCNSKEEWRQEITTDRCVQIF